MRGLQVIVNRSISAIELRKLAATPGLTLDITAIDPKRLPPSVAANIWTSATTFIAPQLRRVGGNLFAPNAINCDLSGLEETAGVTNLQSVTDFRVPNLKKAGDINIRDATRASMPLLETAGDIVALTLKSFSAPNLRDSGYLMIPNVTRFSAPHLPDPIGVPLSERGNFLVGMAWARSEVAARDTTVPMRSYLPHRHPHLRLMPSSGQS